MPPFLDIDVKHPFDQLTVSHPASHITQKNNEYEKQNDMISNAIHLTPFLPESKAMGDE